PAGGLDQADGPSALEPNGNVLAMMSPGLFQSGCQFVEYNPTTNSLADAPNPEHCPSDSSYVGHLMILPTGQIMFTDFSGTVEIYTPASGIVSGVAPTIPWLNSSRSMLPILFISPPLTMRPLTPSLPPSPSPPSSTCRPGSPRGAITCM